MLRWVTRVVRLSTWALFTYVIFRIVRGELTPAMSLSWLGMLVLLGGWELWYRNRSRPKGGEPAWPPLVNGSRLIDLVCSLVPGWLVVAGIVLQMVLRDIVDWSQAFFAGMTLLAVVLIGLGDSRRRPTHGDHGTLPPPSGSRGSLPIADDLKPRGWTGKAATWTKRWVAGVGRMVGVGDLNLGALSQDLDVDQRVLKVASRVPWFMLAAFWVLLMTYLVARLAWGAQFD